MKTSKQEESVDQPVSTKELIQRGQEYIQLDAISRWVDEEFFRSESPYKISDKFWRASQNNLRRLKTLVKELEDFRTDISKAWKKKVGLDEKLYELGSTKDEEIKKNPEYKAAKIYAWDIDSDYKKHYASDEIKKEFDDFYAGIKPIEFYKVEASVIEALELPFEYLYLIEKYYQS